MKHLLKRPFKGQMKRFGLIILFFLLACTAKKEVSPAVSTPPVASANLFDIPDNQKLLVVAENLSITPKVYEKDVAFFSITPQLPLGLSLNPKTGEISGVLLVPQSNTRYVLTLTNQSSLSSQKEIYLEVRPDISLISNDVKEVTSTSGKTVNLKDLVQNGKGHYRFQMRDDSFGVITQDGLFTPKDRAGETEILVKDNYGLGTEIVLKIKIGVPALSIQKIDPLEGDDARIILSLSGKTTQDIALKYTVKRVTALSSTVDEIEGYKILPKGTLLNEIDIPTHQNDIYKPDTSFELTLSLQDENARFLDTADKQKVLNVVVGNKVLVPEIGFAVTNMQFIEADENLNFEVRLSRPSLLPISVKIQLDKNISTMAPTDYVFLDQTLNFPVYFEGSTVEPKVVLSALIYHDRNGNLPQDPDRLLSFLLSAAEGGRLSDKNRLNVNVRDPVFIEVASSVSDFVLLDELTKRAWNQKQDVIVRVKPGVIVSSSSPTHAAFSSGYIPLATSARFLLQNYGKISGAFGRGGKALLPLSLDGCSVQVAGEDGESGGDAIAVTMPIRVENFGEISGGGGGGGGGFSAFLSDLNCLKGQSFLGSDGGNGGSLALDVVSSSPYASKGGDGGGFALGGQDAFNPALFLLNLSPAKGGSPGRAFSTSSSGLIDLYNPGVIKTP